METLPRNDVQPDVISDTIRHRWRIIVVTTVLLTLVGVLFARSVSPTYAASTEILLKPTVGNALSPDSAKSSQQITIAMQTEAGLVASPEVAALVAAEVKAPVNPASTAVAVSVPTNTQLVQLTYTANTPAAAQQYAAAYAKAVLANRQAQSKASLDQQLAALNTQEKTAADNLKQATADASVASPGPDAVARVQLYTNRVSSLQDSIGQISATDTDPGALVTPATVPTSSAGLNPLLYIIVAGLLGLALGGVLALWRELGDDRIRTKSEAVVLGVPVLGTVAGRTDEARVRESYRQIRSGLLALTLGRAVVSVSSVSADAPGSAASRALEVAVRTGQSVRDSGRTVVVVDATLGAGRFRSVPGAASVGLSDALDGSATVEEIVQDVDGLPYVGAGVIPEESRDLFASPRMAEIATSLQSTYDLVLIAALPLATSEGSDACLASERVLGVLTRRTTTHDQLRETLERISQLGVPALGLVELPRHAHHAAAPAQGSAAEGPEAQGSAAEDSEVQAARFTEPAEVGEPGQRRESEESQTSGSTREATGTHEARSIAQPAASDRPAERELSESGPLASRSDLLTAGRQASTPA